MKHPSSTTAQRRSVNQGYGRFSHQYELPTGERYDSVTSILGVIAKPALINWAANKEREMVMEAAADLYEDLPLNVERMKRASFLATLSNRIGTTKAHQKELDKAGEIGSQAHALIEWNLRQELKQQPGPQPAVTSAAALAFSHYENWRTEVDLEPKLIEQVVWSRSHEYAGTLDLLGMAKAPFGEMVQVVIDWKTGKGIYPEASMQSAAYIKALLEMQYAQPPVWGLIVRLPKIESDPAFETLWISPEEQVKHFDGFLAAKDLWNWQQQTQRKA